MTSGYRWGYNEDLVFDSASVIKAPYILSVLEVISKDEQDYLDRLEAQNLEPEMIDTDGDGTPDSIKYEYSDPSYDLSEVVVYDSKTMMQSGSGKIQERRRHRVHIYRFHQIHARIQRQHRVSTAAQPVWLQYEYRSRKG